MLKFTLPENTELTEPILKRMLELHDFEIMRYHALDSYYLGQHDITNRALTDATKPNNRLVNNYAKYITDVSTGYFLGKPVTYSTDDDPYNDRLQEIFKISDEQDENSEIGKQCSIKGLCYELLYMDSDSQPRFKYVKPENGFLVYDDTVSGGILYGVRRYRINDITQEMDYIEKVEVYTPEKVTYMTRNMGELTFDRKAPHYFGEVPIIEFKNNEEQQGDFEQIISLVNAYNLSQSDTANDFEYFTDAYLALIGFGAGMVEGEDDDTIKTMRENRILLLNENGDAKWLVKNINDSATENYKNRLQKDIHRFSMVPNLTDEEFAGNLSGVALKYKLWGLEQSAVNKERKFKTAFIRRIRLITNILNIKGNNFDSGTVKLEFHRNMPQNLLEITQMTASLTGLVSKQTQLELLPYIEDPQAELDRVDEENQAGLNDNYNTDKTQDEDVPR